MVLDRGRQWELLDVGGAGSAGQDLAGRQLVQALYCGQIDILCYVHLC